MRGTLDKYISEGGHDLEAALDTLGKAETPDIVQDTADKVRAHLCQHYKVASQETGLQGPLIQAMTKAIGDPDTEVVRWIVDKATPLGIDKPIQSCGIFPSAEPVAADDESEAAGHSWNYASYEEHRANADKLLQRELDMKWLDWHHTEEELERAYGKVTYSRIGGDCLMPSS